MSKPCIVKTNLESFTKKLKLEVAHTKYTNLKKTNFDKLEFLFGSKAWANRTTEITSQFRHE